MALLDLPSSGSNSLRKSTLEVFLGASRERQGGSSARGEVHRVEKRFSWRDGDRKGSCPL